MRAFKPGVRVSIVALEQYRLFLHECRRTARELRDAKQRRREHAADKAAGKTVDVAAAEKAVDVALAAHNAASESVKRAQRAIVQRMPKHMRSVASDAMKAVRNTEVDDQEGLREVAFQSILLSQAHEGERRVE